MKNVLFFAPYSMRLVHFEIELGLAKEHLMAGNRVVWLSCSRTLAQCDFNQPRLRSTCVRCMGKRDIGLKLLEALDTPGELIHQPIPMPLAEDQSRIEQLPTRFESHEQLQSVALDNFDLGWAVSSTMISAHRNPDVDLNAHANVTADLVRGAAGMYLAMRRLLENTHPKFDQVYILNGRYAMLRAALRACQATKIPAIIHERGGGPERVELYHNHLPHDIEGVARMIQQSWDSADPETRLDTAKKFFENQLNRTSERWPSFVTGQDAERLPENWDENATNLAIFNSSENEYAAIGKEWKNPLYTNQLEALTRIRNDLQSLESNINVYLRCHPNLITASPALYDQLRGLEGPRFRVIAPRDDISSYALMFAADRVLTFGSTIGAEAAYWGKPSILAGRTYYEGFGSTYNARSHEHLMDLITSDLTPKSPDGSARYGHYIQTYGRHVDGFSCASFFDPLFDGQRLRLNGKSRLLKNILVAIESLRPAA